MAEFCLKCWNKMNGTNNKKRKYVLSEDLDLCEGCGEWTHVVVAERGYEYIPKSEISFLDMFQKFRNLFVKKRK